MEGHTGTLTSTVRTFVSRHRLLAGGAVLLVIGAGVFVLAYFEPQQLFIDKQVNEAAPTVAAPPATQPTPDPAATGAAAPPAASTEPRVLGRGGFRSLEHTTTGQAVVIELPDGSRVLRLESFRTSNGPDLRVYLSAGSSDAGFGREYGEDFVELGELKGNIGDQNYTVPAGVDLSRYRNAVIWCKRFSVGFGVATLE